MQPEGGKDAFSSNWVGRCSGAVSWDIGSLHHAEYQECTEDFMDHLEAVGGALCDGHGVFGECLDGKVSERESDHFRWLSGQGGG